MSEYIIKSGLCLMVLFSFYKLFLEGERLHSIKRVYLILMVVISLILPLISFSYAVEMPSQDLGNTVTLTSLSSAPVNYEVPWWKEQLSIIILVIYIIGFSVSCFRFYKNLRALITEAKKNDQLKDLPYIYVLLGRKLAPHSFFQYIFLNRQEFNNGKIASAVIEHEKAHVDQKHSLDILLLELIHTIFWFNPVFIFIKRSVKLNHEFLADHCVLQKAYNPLEYSNILLQYSSGHHHNSLSSPINHSLIKKRIIMITKSFSLRRLLLRSFIFLPVLGGCVYLFNEEIVAKPVLANTEIINITSGVIQQQDRTIKIKVEDETILLNGKSVILDDFSEAIDRITATWSQEDMKNPWFEIDFEKATTPFIQKLNKEYRKTKLSKISATEFLAPDIIARKGTPPPPPPPPVWSRKNNVSPPPPSVSEDELKEDHLFSIQIKGDKIKVNGKQTTLDNFKNTLDELTKGKTSEELKNTNFHMQIIDPETGFIERVNKEFKKTRLSEISGHKMLPPPPPAPPAEIERNHRERAHNWKKMKDAERKVIVKEKDRIRAEKKKLIEDKNITQSERAKIQASLRNKEVEINRKMRAIERNRSKIEREHKILKKEHMLKEPSAPPNPPSAPDPLKSIDELEKEGGSFYLNGREISVQKARELVKSKNYSKIDILQTGDSNGKLEIREK